MKTKSKDKAKRKTNLKKRSKTKYPNLDPKLNLKIRQDLFECDYLDKLNDKEKAWLDQFNSEFINASFNSKSPEKNLHKTKKQRKTCYDSNNARNRDILSRAQAQSKAVYLEDIINANDGELEHALGLSDSSDNGGGDGENL